MKKPKHIANTTVVLIGVGNYPEEYLTEYQNDIQFPSQKQILNNIKLLEDTLPKVLPGKVTITDPMTTANKLCNLLANVRSRAETAKGECDLFILYYCGHGHRHIQGDEDRVILTTHETTKKNIKDKGISISRLCRAMNKVGNAKKLLILDCCYSGHAEEEFSLKGETALWTSCSRGEKSYISDDYTLFTKKLVDKLRSGLPLGTFEKPISRLSLKHVSDCIKCLEEGKQNPNILLKGSFSDAPIFTNLYNYSASSSLQLGQLYLNCDREDEFRALEVMRAESGFLKMAVIHGAEDDMHGLLVKRFVNELKEDEQDRTVWEFRNIRLGEQASASHLKVEFHKQIRKDKGKIISFENGYQLLNQLNESIVIVQITLTHFCKQMQKMIEQYMVNFWNFQSDIEEKEVYIFINVVYPSKHKKPTFWQRLQGKKYGIEDIPKKLKTWEKKLWCCGTPLRLSPISAGDIRTLVPDDYKAHDYFTNTRDWSMYEIEKWFRNESKYSGKSNK